MRKKTLNLQRRKSSLGLRHDTRNFEVIQEQATEPVAVESAEEHTSGVPECVLAQALAADSVLDRSLRIELQVTNVDKTPKTRKVINSSLSDNEAIQLTLGDKSYLGTRNSIVLQRNAGRTTAGTKTSEDARNRIQIKRGEVQLNYIMLGGQTDY